MNPENVFLFAPLIFHQHFFSTEDYKKRQTQLAPLALLALLALLSWITQYRPNSVPFNSPGSCIIRYTLNPPSETAIRREIDCSWPREISGGENRIIGGPRREEWRSKVVEGWGGPRWPLGSRFLRLMSRKVDSDVGRVASWASIKRTGHLFRITRGFLAQWQPWFGVSLILDWWCIVRSFCVIFQIVCVRIWVS